jgi:hypothetical protein
MLVAAPSRKLKLKLNEERLVMETLMAVSCKIKLMLEMGCGTDAFNDDSLPDLWKVKPDT